MPIGPCPLFRASPKNKGDSFASRLFHLLFVFPQQQTIAIFLLLDVIFRQEFHDSDGFLLRKGI